PGRPGRSSGAGRPPRRRRSGRARPGPTPGSGAARARSLRTAPSGGVGRGTPWPPARRRSPHYGTSMTLDYLGHIATESDRVADVIARVPTDRPVPSCPEWTAADLWFHLGEVQWHWGRIVADRLTDRAEVRQLGKPDRPDDLAGFFAEASGLLRTALADTPPETPVWTWADDRTAGFVRRRQAHEAVIHRVDAELVAEDRTPLDPALAADGVAEVLTVMYGEPPTDWGEYRPAEDRVLEL